MEYTTNRRFKSESKAPALAIFLVIVGLLFFIIGIYFEFSKGKGIGLISIALIIIFIGFVRRKEAKANLYRLRQSFTIEKDSFQLIKNDNTYLFNIMNPLESILFSKKEVVLIFFNSPQLEINLLDYDLNYEELYELNKKVEELNLFFKNL